MDTQEILNKIAKLKNAIQSESDADVKATYQKKVDALEKQIAEAEQKVEKVEAKASAEEKKDLSEAEQKIKKLEAALSSESDPEVKERYQKKIKQLNETLQGVKEEIKEEKKEIAEQKKDIKEAVKEIKSVDKSVRKVAIKKVAYKISERIETAKKKSKRKDKLKSIVSELDALINKNKKLKAKYTAEYKGTGKTTDKKRDAGRSAKPFGYRFVGKHDYRVPTEAQVRKGLKRGTIDYEARPNRSDVYPKRTVKLADGGMMADGAVLPSLGLSGSIDGTIYRYTTQDIKAGRIQGYIVADSLEEAKKKFIKSKGAFLSGDEIVKAPKSEVARINAMTGKGFMADGGMMADGGIMAEGGRAKAEQNVLNKRIGEYYIDTFKTDDLGFKINSKATFGGLLRVLDNGGNVYEYIGVGDSIIRERVFGKLAKLMNVDYDVIYDKWLFGNKMANGGMMAEGGMMTKGGKTQGYDDREDERLAMKHGKIARKRLESTLSRRDDARFEERMDDGGIMNYGGMMAHGRSMANGGMMAKGGKLGMPEWAVTITSENGDSYDWDGFAKNEDDAVYKAEKEAGFESVESGVNMLTDENGKKIEYKKGGTVKKKPSKKVGKSIQDKHRFAKPAGWRWKEEAVAKKIIERKQLAMSPSKKMRDKYPDYVYYEDRLNKSDQHPTRSSKDSI
jgi:hypothetical protein